MYRMIDIDTIECINPVDPTTGELLMDTNVEESFKSECYDWIDGNQFDADEFLNFPDDDVDDDVDPDPTLDFDVGLLAPAFPHHHHHPSTSSPSVSSPSEGTCEQGRVNGREPWSPAFFCLRPLYRCPS